MPESNSRAAFAANRVEEYASCMRRLVFFLILYAATTAFALTPEEIVRLQQLKTGDALLIRLIENDPLNAALTPAQMIYLKQNGVSDNVLSALLSSGGSHISLPPQEGESHWLNDSARYYYT